MMKAAFVAIWVMVIAVDLGGDQDMQPPADPPRVMREMWEL